MLFLIPLRITEPFSGLAVENMGKYTKIQKISPLLSPPSPSKCPLESSTHLLLAPH
jgi:hypothetical protein